MKRWIVLVVSLLLYATPAGAVTITDGYITAAVVSDFRPTFNLQGEGYQLGPRTELNGEPLHMWTRVAAVGSTQDISGTSRVFSFLPDGLIGSLTFNVAPVQWSPGATAPFTMTGVINGTDLEGGGTFAILALYGVGEGFPVGMTHTNLQSIAFTFEANGLAPVPEPATLFLLGSGLVAMGVWHRRRRR